MRPGLAFLVLSWSAVAGTAAAQPCTGCPAPSFAPAPRALVLPTLTNTSPGPGAVAVDLNGDGFPDLAATMAQGVAVLLADGAGSYGPATLFSGPIEGTSIASADFDRDGHADLVTTSAVGVGSGFFVWRGDGAGALATPVQALPGVPMSGVAAADLNADGKPDVVVGEGTGCAIMMGDGAGAFGPPEVVGAETVVNLTLADVNSDGWPDLVTVGPQGVGVRLGSASGFGPPVFLAAGLTPRDVRAADVDGDTHLDLVVLNYGGINDGVGASVSVLRGNGAGAFSPAVSQPVAVKGAALAVSDFDRDGKADAAVGSNLTLSVLLGQANATLLPHLVMSVHDPIALAAADFDQDGFPDITLVGSGPIAVLFQGDGTGGLALPPFYDLVSRPRGMAVGDLNGDGIPDAAVSRDTNDVAILLGSPGGFVAGPTIPIGAVPGTLATGDFNNDGRADLAVLALAPDRVRVFLATAAGGFNLAAAFPAGPYPGGMAVGDLNNDGKADIVAGNAQNGVELYVFLGNGDGTFGAALTVPADRPAFPVLADVNHDGNLDVLTVPNFFPLYRPDDQPRPRSEGPIPNLELFLGNGNGSLQPAVQVPVDVPSDPIGFALADVNADLYPDLFVASAGGVYLALNDGSGGFGPPALIYQAVAATWVTLADVNGDGRKDVIAVVSGGIAVLVADGMGGFQAGQLYAQRGSLAVAALDLDGDSRPEIAYPPFDGNGVKLLWNTNCRTRRFRIATDLPTCSSPGQPFATQPVIRAIDDGGNRIQCETGGVKAVFVPGAAPPGATILGTSSLSFVAGVATFADLAVDLPGSYQLKYERPLGPPRVRGRSFSQGLSVAIAGPAVVQAGTSVSYSASPGFQWYDWALDAAPVSTARTATLSFPSLGSYALAVAARQDGCTVNAGLGVVAGPLASAAGGSVGEGDAGGTSLGFTLSLSAASAVPVSVSYATADVTALAGSDYTAASGAVSFAPGETSKPVGVTVLGDLQDEPDEIFALQLTAGSNAVAGPGGTGRILDDDGTVNAGLPGELIHGIERRDSLESLAGQEQSRWYVMRQAPWSSYEVAVDGVSGDVAPLQVERLAADGSLLQSAPVGAGTGASLAWENASATSVVGERIRVQSGGCSTACGAEAGYRIRAYETTDSLARFNNQPNQTTFLVLVNGARDVVSGHARFWKEPEGALLATYPFSLAPRQVLLLNTATLPGVAGVRGAVTVSSDAPYGALFGKTSGVDPVLGFSFDTPIRPRPR